MTGSPRASPPQNDSSISLKRFFQKEFAKRLFHADIDALSSLRGIFTGTLIVPDLQQVVAFRDLLGAATAYYRETGDSFAISSSACLLARAANSVTEDADTIYRHFSLTGSRVPGRTAFESVSELLPGEMIERRHNRSSFGRKSWRPERIASTVDTSNLSDLIRQRLKCAIDRILPEEGDTGIMLSGGMDSGPSASLANQLLRRSNRKLHVVSWSLDDYPEADEWFWVETLAKDLNLPILRVAGSELLPFSSLEKSAVQSDWPDFNPFRPLINACYGMAQANGITNLINSNAGDQLYPASRLVLTDLIQRREYLAAIQRILKALGKPKPGPAQAYAELRCLLSNWKRRHLQPRSGKIQPWIRVSSETVDPTYHAWPPESRTYPVTAYAEQILGMGLSGSLAHENDFSLRYDVNRIDPFYDPDLAGLFLSIPFALHYDGSQSKSTMRRAMQGHLPENFRTKPRTGLLTPFFHAGFEENRSKIRDLLSVSNGWKTWVRSEPVNAVLSGTDQSSRGRLIVSACIGYCLWKERIASDAVTSVR